ncbi:MAG: Dabb family protein [Alphaproteobacteria bacterium]|nr:Dabb family protein [Alphaproteobacteria bacterium]
MPPATFRHTCLFALRRPVDDALLTALEAFAGRFREAFPAIRRYRFDRNLSRKAGRHTLVLYSEFDDAAAFQAYVRSALHDEIAAFLAPLVEETLIADLVC